MKKIALTTLALALSVPAMANTLANNLYVQADAGYSQLKASGDTLDIDGGDASVRVAVGTTVGQTRYALDYTRFGGADHSTYGNRTFAANEVAFIPAGTYTVENNTEVDAHSVGVSAYYDFANNSKLTPYVGGRVALNRISRENNQEIHVAFNDFDMSEAGVHKNNVGLGVSAGVAYRILPALTADAGVEYNYLGKIEDYKVDQYGAKVGLRYQF